MPYDILPPAGPLPTRRRVKAFKMPTEFGGQWVPLLWTRRLSSDQAEGVVLLSKDPVQTMRIEFDPKAWPLMRETEIEW